MKGITLGTAAELSSPNPLFLVCTEKENGSTNFAPISFISYLSFKPAMIGFSMGKNSYSGESIRETKNVILTVPGVTLKDAVMAYGRITGRNSEKIEEHSIVLQDVPESKIKIPMDTKLAFIAHLDHTIEVGDHYFYICNISKIYGDASKEALFSWNGYSEISAAQKK